jgi:hypothetical protein
MVGVCVWGGGARAPLQINVRKKNKAEPKIKAKRRQVFLDAKLFEI